MTLFDELMQESNRLGAAMDALRLEYLEAGQTELTQERLGALGAKLRALGAELSALRARADEERDSLEEEPWQAHGWHPSDSKG